MLSKRLIKNIESWLKREEKRESSMEETNPEWEAADLFREILAIQERESSEM